MIDTTKIQSSIAEMEAEASGAADYSGKLEEQTRATGSQIGAWVLLGNGGALLLCFNGLLNHQICDWSVFRPLVSLFLFGLIAAFCAILVGHLVMVSTTQNWHKYKDHCRIIAKLSKRAVALAQELQAPAPSAELVAEFPKRHAALQSEADEQANVKAQLDRSSKAHETALNGANLVLIAAMLAFAFGLFWAVSAPEYANAVCPVSR